MSIRIQSMTSFSLTHPLEPRHVLAFRLAGRWRGLVTDRIVRVAEIHHCSPLPSDLRCNLGLVVHRDVVAGLVDLEMLERLNQHAAVSDGADRPTAAADLVATPPFFCVFARFPRGVAGFPIEGMPTLVRRSEPESDGSAWPEISEISPMRPEPAPLPTPLEPSAPDLAALTMVDLDLLEVFT